ncbi:MAG: glycosyltransferase family 4 protein, partial [Actinobacteria bacterium]|nr:glycosyltransferase family 4 protein [Actinomycetota bacterium]
IYKDINNLRFFGYISHREIPKFLRSSDILLMPYEKVINEPGEINTAEYCSPMKLFEYLASGKPFVASNLPSLLEVLENEKNCLLAEPGVYEDWADKVGLLLKDKKLRSNLSHGAFQTALSHTWDARVTKIFNFAYGR